MERHHYTPTLKRAISRLESVTAGGGSYVRSRGRNRRSAPVGKGEARQALAAVTHATDVHTINGRTDLCVGDEIVFVREQVSTEMGSRRSFQASYRRSYSYTLIEAGIDSIAPGVDAQCDLITVRFADGRTESIPGSYLGFFGVWRKRWADENKRDGCVAELIAQRQLARDDKEQYGRSVAS